MLNFNNASNEQLTCLLLFISGFNLIVDAVAGSGKTYTILLICLRLLGLFPKKKCLIITYNKDLKEEVRIKINKYKLKNVDMHNYHAIGVNYYKKPKGYPDDEFLQDIINKDIRNIKTIDYDYIFVDETQDVRPLYFKLIQKVLNDNRCKNPTIAVFGDIHQTLYSFRGSDRRFLTLANHLFYTNKDWKELKLSQSFRVTKPIANFVNHVLLNEERIISNKDSENKVDYIICDVFNKYHEIVNIIQKYVVDGTYKKDEIFILANSISNRNSKCVNPIQRISNLLSAQKFQVATTMNDEDSMSKNIQKNKICIQTICSSKGLERKLVIVLGFDNGFFVAGNNEKLQRNICPDPIYVACTRATDKLIIVHGSSNDYLPFIHRDHLNDLDKYVNMINLSKLSIITQPPNIHPISVTELCKYLSVEDIQTARKYIKYKCIQPKSDIIRIPYEIETSKGYEHVSDITGIAIPMWYEFLTDKTCTNLKYIINIENSNIKQIFSKNTGSIIECIKSIDPSNLQFNECLKLATLYQCLKNKFGHKFNQIDKDRYNWIDKHLLDKIMERMSKHINEQSKYEQLYIGRTANYISISGEVDIVDNDTIWEIKCTNDITDIHKFQLALYARLINKDYKYKLFNPLTNEIHELIFNESKLDKLMEFLYSRRYKTIINDTDDTFIKKNKNVIQNNDTDTEYSTDSEDEIDIKIDFDN